MVKYCWIYLCNCICFQKYLNLWKFLLNSLFCSVCPGKVLPSDMISHVGVGLTVSAVDDDNHNFTIIQLNNVLRDLRELLLMNPQAFHFLLDAKLSLLLVDVLPFDELVRVLMLETLACVGILGARSCFGDEEGSFVHSRVVVVVQESAPVATVFLFQRVVLLRGQMVSFHEFTFCLYRLRGL